MYIVILYISYPYLLHLGKPISLHTAAFASPRPASPRPPRRASRSPPGPRTKSCWAWQLPCPWRPWAQVTWAESLMADLWLICGSGAGSWHVTWNGGAPNLWKDLRWKAMAARPQNFKVSKFFQLLDQPTNIYQRQHLSILQEKHRHRKT